MAARRERLRRRWSLNFRAKKKQNKNLFSTHPSIHDPSIHFSVTASPALKVAGRPEPLPGQGRVTNWTGGQSSKATSRDADTSRPFGILCTVDAGQAGEQKHTDRPRVKFKPTALRLWHDGATCCTAVSPELLLRLITDKGNKKESLILRGGLVQFSRFASLPLRFLIGGRDTNPQQRFQSRSC